MSWVSPSSPSRIGAGHNPVAGEDPGCGALKFGAAYADRPRPVAPAVHPADRAGVAASIESLHLLQVRQGGVHGIASDRCRRVHPGDQFERGFPAFGGPAGP